MILLSSVFLYLNLGTKLIDEAARKKLEFGKWLNERSQEIERKSHKYVLSQSRIILILTRNITLPRLKLKPLILSLEFDRI